MSPLQRNRQTLSFHPDCNQGRSVQQIALTADFQFVSSVSKPIFLLLMFLFESATGGGSALPLHCKESYAMRLHVDGIVATVGPLFNRRGEVQLYGTVDDVCTRWSILSGGVLQGISGFVYRLTGVNLANTRA